MPRPERQNERNQVIFDLRESGTTLEEISQMFGISKQRVSAICGEVRKWNQRANDPLRKIIEKYSTSENQTARCINYLNYFGVFTVEDFVFCLPNILLRDVRMGAGTAQVIMKAHMEARCMF